MKNKINVSNLTNILKSVLLGIIITLVGVLVLAIILKFSDIPTNVVGYINSAIKILAIFLVCLSLSKRIENNYLINCIVAGASYALICYGIFSIINGSFAFGSNNIIDLLFALFVATISSIIVSLFRRKTA